MSAFAVIDAVIKSFCARIFAHGTASVVGDVTDIRRKKTLIGFMHARGDVRPPEKSLCERCAIVGAHFQFEKTFAGMQTNAVHARSEERRVGKECRSRWSP